MKRMNVEEKVLVKWEGACALETLENQRVKHAYPKKIRPGYNSGMEHHKQDIHMRVGASMDFDYRQPSKRHWAP